MFRYLRALGCESWRAEEIVQEAFLRLHARRREGLQINDPRAWLFRVGRNLWTDSRREQQHYGTENSIDSNSVGSAPDPEQRLLRHERLRLISAEMSRLPKLQQDCLRLKARGFRYHEIAASLGIPASAAVDHVRRAVSRLRKRSEPER